MSQTQAEALGVLFVCTGNICRSPTADAIFQALVTSRGLQDHFKVDSAGLYAHVDEAPDHRSAYVARQNGIPLDHLRGRQFSRQDFQDFHYIFAMDAGHYRKMHAMVPSHSEAELHMFLDFPSGQAGPHDVPDPYYGGDRGFHDVYEMIYAGCERILDTLYETRQRQLT
jgi:protein-tyrosine phosphatase